MSHFPKYRRLICIVKWKNCVQGKERATKITSQNINSKSGKTAQEAEVTDNIADNIRTETEHTGGEVRREIYTKSDEPRVAADEGQELKESDKVEKKGKGMGVHLDIYLINGAALKIIIKLTSPFCIIKPPGEALIGTSLVDLTFNPYYINLFPDLTITTEDNAQQQSYSSSTIHISAC